MKRALAVVALLLAQSVVILSATPPATASNGTERDGCVGANHEVTATHDHRTYTADISGTSGSACPDESGFTMTEGSCVTVTTHEAHSGTSPPSSPTGLYLAFFVDNQLNDHGAAGTSSWSGTGFIKKATWTTIAAFTGATTQFCATSTGSSGGTSAPGTFRMVLRVCNYVGPTGDGCAGTSATYDWNTDTGNSGGNKGTAQGITNVAQGAIRGDMAPTCFQDSTTQAGSDFSTYVGGEARWLRICDKMAILSTGIEAVELQVIPQAGGAALDSTYSSSIRTGDNADAAFTTGLTYSGAGSYPNNTSPTKRAIIANNSALRAAPWTTFASAPSGCTLTSSTQIDCAWASVDVGLRIGGDCYIQDPDVTAARPVWILHHYQTVLARSCTVQNGRAENLDSGTFLRVYRRNSNVDAFGASTDVATCDTTTGSAGAWTCDADTNGNSAATSGRPFVLDVEQFSTSGRTTSWAQGTLAGRFDITTTNNPSPVGEGDPIWVGVHNTNVSTTESITIRSTFDNGTDRTGAAANISIYAYAPDGTWAVNGAHPTEMTLPDGNPWGYYWYNFTPAKVGTYIVFATAKTTLSENRSSAPVTFQSLSATASSSGGGGAGPPLSAQCGFSWQTHAATCAITALNTDGTGRTGIAGSLTVAMYDPADASIASMPAATELVAPGAYVVRKNLGTAPATGTYVFTVSTTIDAGTTRATAKFDVEENQTLLLHDQRTLLSLIWDSMNASFTDLKGHVDGVWAKTNATDADVLLNAAAISAARAEQNLTAANVAAARGDINATRTNLEGARLDLNATRADLDGARSDANITAANVAAARADQNVTYAQLALTHADLNETHDDVEEALAATAQVETYLSGMNLSIHQSIAAEEVNLTLAVANAQHDIEDALNGTLGLQGDNITNLTSAVQNVSLILTSAAFTSAPPVNFTWATESVPLEAWTGRPARFNASTPGTPYAAVTYLWDFGDNTTAYGSTAYHTFAKNGSYNVTLAEANGVGYYNTTNRTVIVNQSAPVANITGPSPAVVTQGDLVPFSSNASVDAHDTIVAWHWQVDADTWTDVPWIGTWEVNAGHGSDPVFYYAFTLTGNHTVELVVTNAHGVTNRTTFPVLVRDVYGFQGPHDPVANQDLAGHATETAQHQVGRVEGFLSWLTRLFS